MRLESRAARDRPKPERSAQRHSSAGEELSASYRRDLRLGYLIHDVSRLRRTAFDQLMRPRGVTRAQWWVLAFLARRDGTSQTQLAGILDLGKAALGSLLDRLEAGGWVVRRPDPVDGRAKRVFLTRKSARLLEQMRRVERRFNDHILKGLSSDERSELIRKLSKIKQSLAELTRNGPPADGRGEE